MNTSQQFFAMLCVAVGVLILGVGVGTKLERNRWTKPHMKEAMYRQWQESQRSPGEYQFDCYWDASDSCSYTIYDGIRVVGTLPCDMVGKLDSLIKADNL